MFSSRHKQRGLSLIELMISMALGLVLVAGAAQIFLTNTQAFRLQTNISGAQEAGRLGLEILMADLRRAGVDGPSGILAGKSLEYGVTGRDSSATTAAISGLLADSDEVTVAYKVPPEVGTMSDCEGHVAAAGTTIVNRYFIKLDGNPDIPALFCEGKVDGTPAVASGGVALIRGVESFQVQYGLAASYGAKAVKGNGFTAPVRYVLGGNGTIADVDGAPGIDEKDAVIVAAIRIAMLVRSESGIAGVRAPSNAIAVLDSQVSKDELEKLKINDLYPVHRLFTATAAVRNTAYGFF